MKKIVAFSVILILVFSMTACSLLSGIRGVSQDVYDALEKERDALEERIDSLEDKMDNLLDDAAQTPSQTPTPTPTPVPSEGSASRPAASELNAPAFSIIGKTNGDLKKFVGTNCMLDTWNGSPIVTCIMENYYYYFQLKYDPSYIDYWPQNYEFGVETDNPYPNNFEIETIWVFASAVLPLPDEVVVTHEYLCDFFKQSPDVVFVSNLMDGDSYEADFIYNEIYLVQAVYYDSDLDNPMFKVSLK